MRELEVNVSTIDCVTVTMGVVSNLDFVEDIRVVETAIEYKEVIMAEGSRVAVGVRYQINVNFG